MIREHGVPRQVLTSHHPLPAAHIILPPRFFFLFTFLFFLHLVFGSLLIKVFFSGEKYFFFSPFPELRIYELLSQFEIPFVTFILGPLPWSHL